MVYTELLLWLQDHSGCLVLKAPPLITQGNGDSWWGVEKLPPSRAAHHQGEAGMCQGTQSLSLVPIPGGRREALQVLWVAYPSLSLCQFLQHGALLTYNISETVLSRILCNFLVGKPRVKFQALPLLIDPAVVNPV